MPFREIFKTFSKSSQFGTFNRFCLTIFPNAKLAKKNYLASFQIKVRIRYKISTIQFNLSFQNFQFNRIPKWQRISCLTVKCKQTPSFWSPISIPFSFPNFQIQQISTLSPQQRDFMSFSLWLFLQGI